MTDFYLLIKEQTALTRIKILSYKLFKKLKKINLGEINMDAATTNKLMEISRNIAKMSEGISYISHKKDHYIIGTVNYDEKIGQYLDKVVKTWKGKDADQVNLKKRKGKQNYTPKIAYFWKIPLTDNNLL